MSPGAEQSLALGFRLAPGPGPPLPRIQSKREALRAECHLGNAQSWGAVVFHTLLPLETCTGAARTDNERSSHSLRDVAGSFRKEQLRP